jgi:hypothetical protein
MTPQAPTGRPPVGRAREHDGASAGTPVADDRIERPHRMACARCDFYIPKPSSEAQLLEAKDGIQRMLVQIPLTEDERAAVEGDQTAVDRLLDELVDTPTPAGATPREIGGTGPEPDTKTLDGAR